MKVLNLTQTDIDKLELGDLVIFNIDSELQKPYLTFKTLNDDFIENRSPLIFSLKEEDYCKYNKGGTFGNISLKFDDTKVNVTKGSFETNETSLFFLKSNLSFRNSEINLSDVIIKDSYGQVGSDNQILLLEKTDDNSLKFKWGDIPSQAIKDFPIVTENIGGFKYGDKIPDATTFQEVFEKLLVKYNSPIIDSISNPLSKTVEVFTSIPNSSHCALSVRYIENMDKAKGVSCTYRGQNWGLLESDLNINNNNITTKIPLTFNPNLLTNTTNAKFEFKVTLYGYNNEVITKSNYITYDYYAITHFSNDTTFDEVLFNNATNKKFISTLTNNVFPMNSGTYGVMWYYIPDIGLFNGKSAYYSNGTFEYSMIDDGRCERVINGNTISYRRFRTNGDVVLGNGSKIMIK